MKETDKRIKAIWDRMKKEGAVSGGGTCLDDKQLLYYVDGVLNESEKARVEQHLLSCDECLHLIVSYEKLRHEPLEAAPDVLREWNKKIMNMLPGKESAEGVFDIVIRVAKEALEIIRNPGNLTVIQGPIPVSVRGVSGVVPDNFITVSKTFSDIRSEVEIERTGGAHINIRVVVTNTFSGMPVQGLRISVFDLFSEKASYISENGEAYFTEMRLDKYTIRLMRKGKKVGQVSLDLEQ